MIFEKYTTGKLMTNSYIIGDENTRNIALIDTSDGIDEILSVIKEKFYNVKYLLITHGHFDHILGASRVRDVTGAKVVMSRAEQGFAPLLRPDIAVEDGDVISFDGFNISVIATPGHTPGGVCYKYRNILFTGDTLFHKTIGRCDLEGGNFALLKKSISEKLLVLDDGVNVYPGHGEESTIGFEKKHNPYFV